MVNRWPMVISSADAELERPTRNRAVQNLHVYPSKKPARPGSQCSRNQAQDFQVGSCTGTAINGGKSSDNSRYNCSCKHASCIGILKGQVPKVAIRSLGANR